MTIANLLPDEVDKFNRLASRWWDPAGALWTLHAINPLRMRFIEQHLNLAESKVLDVGCGGGILTEAIARRGAMATGIDLADEVIQTAKVHAFASDVQVSYQVRSVADAAAEMPEVFDVLTCMELIEHVPDPAALVENCASLVRPGGMLFFSTLNRSLKSFFQAIVAAEHILKLVPKGTHHYRHFIKPAELVAWGRANRLQVLKFQGIGYHPLTKRFFLQDKPDVNYLVSFKKQQDACT